MSRCLVSISDADEKSCLKMLCSQATFTSVRLRFGNSKDSCGKKN